MFDESSLINGASRITGFLDDDLTQRTPVLDSSTHALAIINHICREIHKGHAYCLTMVNTSMDNEATLVAAFKTPNTLENHHLAMVWVSKADAHIELLEAPAWTAGSGSQHAINNRNRCSSNVSNLLENTGGTFVASGKVVKDPTGLTGGLILWENYIWGDKKSGPSLHRDEQAYLLKTNTQYAVRLTADAASNAGWFCLIWYEHVDKN